MNGGLEHKEKLRWLAMSESPQTWCVGSGSTWPIIQGSRIGDKSAERTGPRPPRSVRKTRWRGVWDVVRTMGVDPNARTGTCTRSTTRAGRGMAVRWLEEDDARDACGREKGGRSRSPSRRSRTTRTWVDPVRDCRHRLSSRTSDDRVRCMPWLGNGRRWPSSRRGAFRDVA